MTDKDGTIKIMKAFAARMLAGYIVPGTEWGDEMYAMIQKLPNKESFEENYTATCAALEAGLDDLAESEYRALSQCIDVEPVEKKIERIITKIHSRSESIVAKRNFNKTSLAAYKCGLEEAEEILKEELEA